MKKEALKHTHKKESGHLGQHKTVLKTEEYFYWPNLKKDVKQYVSECISCHQLKASRGLQQLWQELPPVNQPMERISIDVTNMSSGAVGHRYVLIVIDHFLCFVNLHPITSRTAENIIKNIVIESYGTPRVLSTDNAKEFCSETLTAWCRSNGVRLVHLTPYHPQGNSISKRMHRTMKAVLTTLCKGQLSRWPQFLKKCQRILNSAVHETTGEQLHYLMFNRRAPRIVGVEVPQMEQDKDLEVALEIVRRTNLEQARKWRRRVNIGRKDQGIEINQLVWVKKDYTTSLSDRKLGVKWIGPYKVKEVLRDGGAYRLESVFDGVTTQRAADKIKSYIGSEGIFVQLQEVFFQREEEEEDEEEPRPVRECRPPRRYIEDDEPRPVRERRPPRRYGEVEDKVLRQEQVEDSEEEEGRETEGQHQSVRPRRPVCRYIEKT